MELIIGAFAFSFCFVFGVTRAWHSLRPKKKLSSAFLDIAQHAFPKELHRELGGKNAILVIDHGYCLQTIRSPGVDPSKAAQMLSKAWVGQSSHDENG